MFGSPNSADYVRDYAVAGMVAAMLRKQSSSRNIITLVSVPHGSWQELHEPEPTARVASLFPVSVEDKPVLKDHLFAATHCKLARRHCRLAELAAVIHTSEYEAVTSSAINRIPTT